MIPKKYTLNNRLLFIARVAPSASLSCFPSLDATSHRHIWRSAVQKLLLQDWKLQPIPVTSDESGSSSPKFPNGFHFLPPLGDPRGQSMEQKITIYSIYSMLVKWDTLKSFLTRENLFLGGFIIMSSVAKQWLEPIPHHQKRMNKMSNRFRLEPTPQGT